MLCAGWWVVQQSRSYSCLGTTVFLLATKFVSECEEKKSILGQPSSA